MLRVSLPRSRANIVDLNARRINKSQLMNLASGEAVISVSLNFWSEETLESKYFCVHAFLFLRRWKVCSPVIILKLSRSNAVNIERFCTSKDLVSIKVFTQYLG